jgi:hypothetical protein
MYSAELGRWPPDDRDASTSPAAAIGYYPPSGAVVIDLSHIHNGPYATWI